MYKLILTFQGRKYPDNTDVIEEIRFSFDKILCLLNIYYIEYSDHVFWKINSFTIEQLIDNQ